MKTTFKDNVHMTFKAVYCLNELVNGSSFLLSPLNDTSNIVAMVNDTVINFHSCKAVHFDEKLYYKNENGFKKLCQSVIFKCKNDLNASLLVQVFFDQYHYNINEHTSFEFNRMYDISLEWAVEGQSEDFIYSSFIHHKKNLLVFYPALSRQAFLFSYEIELSLIELRKDRLVNELAIKNLENKQDKILLKFLVQNLIHNQKEIYSRYNNDQVIEIEHHYLNKVLRKI